jgi:hypothetical protein
MNTVAFIRPLQNISDFWLSEFFALAMWFGDWLYLGSIWLYLGSIMYRHTATSSVRMTLPVFMH